MGYADSLEKLRIRIGRATFVCSKYTAVPTQLLPGPEICVVLANAVSCPSGEADLAAHIVALSLPHPTSKAQMRRVADRIGCIDFMNLTLELSGA